MSDIDLHGLGIGGFFGAIATLGLGALATIVALFVALSIGGPGLQRRLGLYCAGPLACVAIGGVALVVRTSWDGWFFVWPAVGIVASIATALIARREARSWSKAT